jgi:3-deoxy-7-phosphoheptulonate synthase
MIDISHANSRKDFKRQMIVAEEVCQQLRQGERSIFGLMVESNLVEGNQALKIGQPLRYGQSITDACIGWDDTEQLLAMLNDSVLQRRRFK